MRNTTDKAKLLKCILCALVDIVGPLEPASAGRKTNDKAKLLKCILCELQSNIQAP
jgi:hypothetical protein